MWQREWLRLFWFWSHMDFVSWHESEPSFAFHIYTTLSQVFHWVYQTFWSSLRAILHKDLIRMKYLNLNEKFKDFARIRRFTWINWGAIIPECWDIDCPAPIIQSILVTMYQPTIGTAFFTIISITNIWNAMIIRWKKYAMELD